MTSRQATSAYAQTAGPAVRMVGQAVKAGRLTRLPCAECGDSKTQAHHHNGYDREHALDVVWLCRSHHLARHNRSALPTWARQGKVRAYMAQTRPAPYQGRTYQFSDWSSPTHLMKTMERLWTMLRTDEERDWAFALIQRLAESESIA